MFLTATDQKIEAVLSGAVAANQVQFVAAYADITTTTLVPGQNDGVTNDTTDVDVVAAPASSTQRQIKSLSYYNADTAAVEITVKMSNGGTERVLVKATLAAAVTLVWTPEHGWQKGVIGSHSFIDMPDTPGSYTGSGGNAVAVNSGETALEFVTIANSVFGRTGAVTAQSGDYDAGQIDETSSAKIMTGSERTKLAGIESGAEVNDVDSVFGRTGTVTAKSGDYSFLQLGDTPGNYTGDANKVAAVNSAEDAVEFVDTLLMGDGTEALPAYSFASDPDTGIFRPAGNEIGFSIGGVEEARIHSTGRVSVGPVPTPGAKLHVYRNDGTTAIVLQSNAAADNEESAFLFRRDDGSNLGVLSGLVEDFGNNIGGLVLKTINNGSIQTAFRIGASDNILDFRMSMGAGSDDPTVDAPADWIEVKISGTTRYVPVYN